MLNHPASAGVSFMESRAWGFLPAVYSHRLFYYTARKMSTLMRELLERQGP